MMRTRTRKQTDATLEKLQREYADALHEAEAAAATIRDAKLDLWRQLETAKIVAAERGRLIEALDAGLMVAVRGRLDGARQALHDAGGQVDGDTLDTEPRVPADEHEKLRQQLWDSWRAKWLK